MKLTSPKLSYQDSLQWEALQLWVAQLKNEIQPPEEPFTKRELEIIGLIAKGYSSYAIAHMLFISKQTVDTHRKNIYRKGSFRSVRDVVVYQLLNELQENTQRMVLR